MKGVVMYNRHCIICKMNRDKRERERKKVVLRAIVVSGRSTP